MKLRDTEQHSHETEMHGTDHETELDESEKKPSCLYAAPKLFSTMSLGRPCWPPSAYKHFGTHRGEQFVANKKAILSRHDSIQSIAVSCHVHMYAYICIYSCMHRLFLHMIYNRWDKPLDLYRALRRGLLASGTR